MKKYLLEIVVFISGALIMILELVAARVFSPYVGSSNLIWTSIIGVILISMSAGYYIGGRFADKNPKYNNLSIILLITSVLISIIPILEIVLIKEISILVTNVGIVAILCALLVFAIPSFLLATISPYAITLKEIKAKEIGMQTGKLSAFSTVGSITGTFLAGFFFIPTFGVKTIIFILSILALILSVITYKNKNVKYYISIVIVLMILATFNILGGVLFTKSNSQVIADLDSQYDRIWITEIAKKSTGEKYKVLQVNTAIESYIDIDTGKMGAKYLEYYDLFNYYNKGANNILMIGGAGYTYPMHFLKTYSDKNIDVIEIDEKMTQIAKEHFGLTIDDRLNIYHQDGRNYINSSSNKYDIILVDAFKGDVVPFQLTTLEAVTNMNKMLNNNGIVMANVISSIEGENSKFLDLEYQTFKKVFEEVKVFYVNNEDPNTVQNIMLIGFKDKIDYEKVNNYNNMYDDYLNTEVFELPKGNMYLTDDYAPVEMLSL